MRIAILSAFETTADGALCAASPFLGESVLTNQIELALALGARRVICLSQEHNPAILEAQHRLEAQDADFHIAANSLAMVGLIAADDELVIFADSVLIGLTSIPPQLFEKRGICSVGTDIGEALQLERIDAQRFWAGVLIAKGDIAVQLADLPEDSDIVSLLLRLALQARTPIVAMDKMQTGALHKVTDPASLAKREEQAFAEALPKPQWSGIGQALATQGVAALGPRVLPRGHRVAASLVALGCVASMILSALDYSLPAMCALLLAVFSANVLDVLISVRCRLKKVIPEVKKLSYFKFFVDLSITISIALIHLFEAPISALLVAPISIMALRVAALSAARHQNAAAEAIFSDRLTMIVILSLALALGYGMLAAAIISLLSLSFVLFWGARETIRQT